MRTTRPLICEELTSTVIGCAIEVHRTLGPGLLESTYRACLVREFQLSGISAKTEVAVPVTYKGHPIDCGYRADVIVKDEILLELKAVERLLPIHEAQVLTYLKLCDIRVGLLLNFNTEVLRHGLRRLVR